jgi:hypothetical protein
MDSCTNNPSCQGAVLVAGPLGRRSQYNLDRLDVSTDAKSALQERPYNVSRSPSGHKKESWHITC